jgi:magnesium-transporting ATPase (P-type)
MIKSASVGVAIRGKEGNQAASFADYSILRFKDLRRLLFIHGRGFGFRLTNFVIWFVFKSMFLAVPQYFMGFENAFSGY